jgi:hypothetical protein
MSPAPQIAVELPVCDDCRVRGGKGISAEPKKGWIILGGVADDFAKAMVKMFEEEAAEFERGLVQDQSEQPPDGGGFDWSALT